MSLRRAIRTDRRPRRPSATTIGTRDPVEGEKFSLPPKGHCQRGRGRRRSPWSCIRPDRPSGTTIAPWVPWGPPRTPGPFLLGTPGRVWSPHIGARRREGSTDDGLPVDMFGRRRPSSRDRGSTRGPVAPFPSDMSDLGICLYNFFSSLLFFFCFFFLFFFCFFDFFLFVFLLFFSHFFFLFFFCFFSHFFFLFSFCFFQFFFFLFFFYFFFFFEKHN